MANEKRIPLRSEVPVEETWRLEDLYETPEKWEEEAARLAALPAEISAFAGHLADDAATLLKWFQKNDEISVVLNRFFGYAISRAQLFAGVIAQIQLFGLQKGGVSHMVGVEVGNDGADGAGERMQFFQHMISVACIKEPGVCFAADDKHLGAKRLILFGQKGYAVGQGNKHGVFLVSINCAF